MPRVGTHTRTLRVRPAAGPQHPARRTKRKMEETVTDKFREGVLVKPHERLDEEQIKHLDDASMRLLAEPGLWCHNEVAANIYKEHGAKVWEEK